MTKSIYYYPLKDWSLFTLTHNEKRLQTPIDVQFYIEVLKMRFGKHIYASPFIDRLHLKVVIENDSVDHVRFIDMLLRNHILNNY